MTPRFFSRALAAAALALAAAAPAAAQLPFTFTVREAARQPGAPALQSLAWGEHDGLWLLVGGRRNGFHRTSNNESTFPSAWANDSLYVVDVAGGRTWRAPLPQQYRMLLRVNNMQYFQDGDVLYVVGGYGSNCDSDDPSCYQTYPNLTAINVPAVVQAIQAGNAAAIEAGISTVQDERMRVTGGGLKKIGDTFYLVFGQNYDNIYKGGYTGKYTEQVRAFRIGGSGGQPQILDYQAYGATDGGGPASQWHRRDLNVVETVWGDGTAGIAVYGGVFTPTGGAWLNPMYVAAPAGGGPASITLDQQFKMRMSPYECAQVLMYEPASRTMYTTLLGGITDWYYNASGQLVPSSIETNWLPWTAAITTLARAANGATTEVVQPATLQMPQRMGGNAIFVPAPSLATYGGTHEVLDYGKLPALDSVLVGWMYGGIVATADQASEMNPTFANAKVYEVWMNRSPGTAGN
ncbi:MAG TPA: hypothetical protein VFS20_31745 [Longimicrobium sp.]|nr:hypothetical protein [Longimicrobium sp.]